jgi:hypothetical protein
MGRVARLGGGAVVWAKAPALLPAARGLANLRGCRHAGHCAGQQLGDGSHVGRPAAEARAVSSSYGWHRQVAIGSELAQVALIGGTR